MARLASALALVALVTACRGASRAPHTAPPTAAQTASHTAPPDDASAAMASCLANRPDGGARFDDRTLRRIRRMSPPPALAPDPTNRFADDPRAASLGAQLFRDASLSRTGDVSCVGCHDPARAFADGRALAVAQHGARIGRRNTPSLWWSAHLRWQTWDGAADSLWAQPMLAWMNPAEHALTTAALASRLRAGYGDAMRALAGQIPNGDDAVIALAGKSVAAYLRTVRPGPAPFDRWVAGDRSAMGERAVEGLAVFLRVGCVRCHSGPLFTDGDFHAARFPDGADEDRGRLDGAARAQRSVWRSDGPHSDDREAVMPPTAATDESRGHFRTPPLRGVALTAPYGHAGNVATLRDVVGLYARGGDPRSRAAPDPFLVRFDITEAETDALVTFLEALTPDAPSH